MTRADLVTFSDDVATDADCESLAATSLESGYSVAAASRGAGEWNFVVVGYGDGDALLEAGRAKVTLSGEAFFSVMAFVRGTLSLVCGSCSATTNSCHEEGRNLIGNQY